MIRNQNFRTKRGGVRGKRFGAHNTVERGGAELYPKILKSRNEHII